MLIYKNIKNSIMNIKATILQSNGQYGRISPNNFPKPNGLPAAPSGPINSAPLRPPGVGGPLRPPGAMGPPGGMMQPGQQQPGGPLRPPMSQQNQIR